MSDWRVVSFNPTTHEVISRNKTTGAVLTLTVPEEYRTAEKSVAYLDGEYSKYKAPMAAVKPNKYKHLVYFSVAALCFDLLLRVYGV